MRCAADPWPLVAAHEQVQMRKSHSRARSVSCRATHDAAVGAEPERGMYGARSHAEVMDLTQSSVLSA